MIRPARSASLLAAALAATYLAHPDPNGLDSADAIGAAETAGAPAPGSPCPTGSAVVDLVGPDDAGPVADPGEVLSAAMLGAGAPGYEAEPVASGSAAAAEGLWRLSGDPAAVGRAVALLARDARVEVAECDARLRALAPPSEPATWEPDDPLYSRQWHLGAAGAPRAWALSRRLGAGAVVAVVDTGVAPVPDLDPRRLLPGRTFGAGRPGGVDDQGHGTHVAGTVAQWTDNGSGAAGMSRASILPLKVLGPDGGGTLADVAAGIHEASLLGANAINLSLGGGGPSRVLAKAVAEARARGSVVVAAAGNDGRAQVDWPGAAPGAFAVGAVGSSGRRAPYGSHGRDLDLSAPGGDQRGAGESGGVLQQTIVGGDPSMAAFEFYQGTSMATPHVAGAVALLAGAGVTRPAEVEALLLETARPAPGGTAGRRSDEYGAGLLDAGAALDAARGRYALGRFVLLLAGLAVVAGAWLRGASLRAAWAFAVRCPVAAFGGLAAAVWFSGAAGFEPPAYAIGEWLGLLAQGSPLVLSALPAVAAVAVAPRALRPLAAGVAAGTGALLLHGAAALPTLLRDLPGGAGWDRAWLLAHGLAALAIAALALRASGPRSGA